MGELILFYSLAAIVATFSLLVVTVRNPVTAAICLVFDLFFLAGIYALQAAHFIAVIQVIIYAGAIVVLFLFVIMLLNLDLEEQKKNITGLSLAVGVLLFFGAIILYNRIAITETSSALQLPQTAEDHVYEVGMKLFTSYLWPFELASLLILLAIVSSVVIAKKRDKNEVAEK